MRIVYLHQYFTTAGMAGGTRSYEFARRLVRDGHEVHIVTSDRTAAAPARLWSRQDIEGISVHAIGQPYSNSMGTKERIAAFLGFALRSSIKARSLNGDVVFATSTPLTIVIPAFAAIFGRKTPFVMEVRDLWPTVPIALGYLRNPASRLLARGLELLAYKRASRIIALSEDMAKGIRAVGTKADKLAVITNLSDTERFQNPTNPTSWFRRKYPFLVDRPFIVYTGTFGRVNGVDYMVRLATEYAQIDSTLAFVCMGDGAEREKVIALAEETGVLGKNFFVLDQVAKKELPAVLNAALACSSWVIPVVELEANSANKLFDAFAAGRPMLINHGGWQQRLLESTGAGLSLPSSDVVLAAQRLSEHIRDHGWVAKARAASAQLGQDEFEVEKLYRRFVGVLEDAAGVRP